MRKKRKLTARERSMALIKKREKRRLRVKRKEKGQNPFTYMGEYAPNIQAMFREKKEKLEKAKKPKKVKKLKKSFFKRGGKKK